MKFTKKNIIIGVVILLVIIIVLVLIMKSRSSSTTDTKTSTTNNNSSNSIISKVQSALYKPEVYPLAIYMKGNNTGRLQKALNGHGGTLTVDGNFGPATKDELVKQIGKDTITEAELIALENNVSMINSNTVQNAGQPVVSSLPPVSNPNGMLQYIQMLYNDLVLSNNISGRNSKTANGIYFDLANKENTQFASIYSAYVNKYSRDLAKDVDDAIFTLGSSVDTNIINKARSLGLTTIS